MKLLYESFRRHIPFFIGIPAIVWQVLFLYIPLCIVVVLAFSGSTWSTYLASFLEALYLRIIIRSLLMAFLNATACLFIAYPLAYYLVFKAGRSKTFLLFLAIIPFWTNFLLHMYAWFFILEKEGVLNTVLLQIGIISQPLALMNSTGAIAVMMVYFYMPFMILPLYSMLERFDKRLLEASLDLGASWWQTITRVLLPGTLAGIRAGFFLVFVPSFGEFAIPEFMGGDRTMYVGTVISQYVLGAQTSGLGAAFTLVSGCALLIASVFLYYGMEFVVYGLRKEGQS